MWKINISYCLRVLFSVNPFFVLQVSIAVEINTPAERRGGVEGKETCPCLYPGDLQVSRPTGQSEDKTRQHSSFGGHDSMSVPVRRVGPQVNKFEQV